MESVGAKVQSIKYDKFYFTWLSNTIQILEGLAMTKRNSFIKLFRDSKWDILKTNLNGILLTYF
jgi:hypothetical protein